ncbi:hypothetical protein GCM10023185_37780 [Hymenobacter saemangeumensis]|uniref:DUF2157 domain-containing protein n=1 Tax=Hymenobacter saemangeumensis TaxID=1084522 RepID=A0ABP8IQC2_9BACT
MAVKAYHPAWARNAAVRKAASRWQKQGFITPGQHAAIEQAHPLDYYRPPLFLRIGLFLFTCLGALAGAVFVGLATRFNLPAICLLCGIGAIVLLEIITSNPPRHYGSGFDTALLYCALLAVGVFLAYLYEQAWANAYSIDFDSPAISALLLPLLAVFGAATIRYADRLVAACTYLLYLATIANGLLQSSLGQALLPFGIMLASGGAYLLFRRLSRRDYAYYYQKPLTLVKALALISFYLGGNYFVVREGSAALRSLPESTQISFAPLFYLFTVAIPFIYISLSLRRHNRQMLWIGLFVVGFSIYTYRHYRSLLPPEYAATLAGLALIGFAIWALRYLHTPRYGLTAAPDDEQAPLINLEALIVAETATVPTPEPAGFDFGGGSSGGGGATGRF